MKAKILRFILMCFFSIKLSAQISGEVFSKETNKPISNVFIQDIATGRWTTSNNKGKFFLKVTSFPTKLKFHLLGKIEVVKSFDEVTSNIKIVLKDDDLRIDEVEIVAKRKKLSTGSNLILGKQAIDLVQAQSVADVMQLIPGKSLSESELHERQILTLRSAIFNGTSKFNESQGLGNNNNSFLLNNAFGVGYVVDGVPLNNNVNLSGSRGTRLGVFNNLTENNSVGIGVDLKNLALSNIESIEVVQGISSAKYGDHNTGLIKINKAHGYSPFRLRSTLRGGSTGITLTKGFDLGNNNGFLNIGLDYLRSNNDPRNGISTFDRISTDISWSYKEKGVFDNRLSVSFMQNINADNSVVNSISDRRKKVDSKRIRISNTSNWYYTNSFIDKLQLSTSIDYGVNKTVNSVFKNNGGEPVLGSFSEGTFELNYTPVSFRAIENIDNKPFSFFNRIEISKSFERNKNKFNISFGTTLGIDKNFGRGNYSGTDLGLLNSSSTGGKVGYRNINFNNLVPIDIKFSTYLTGKLTSTLFAKKWVTDLGLRYDNYNGQSTIGPRLNSRLSISNKLKYRFGVGFFAKSPSLQTLYPGKLYYDYVLADFRTNTYSFALGHTFVRQYQNTRIKPSKTIKFETGVDVKFKDIYASLTGYYNQQLDGFTRQSKLEIAQLPVFTYTFYPDRKPDYVQTGTTPTVLRYNTPTNALKTSNLGLELLIGTKKIKSINTSFNLSTAYRYTKTINNLPNFVTSKESNSEAFIGLHKGVPITFQTLNSTLTATHHISSIGLVLTLTAEQFWLAKNSNDGSVQFPYAYYDRDLNFFTIPESERMDAKFIPIRKSLSSTESSSNNIPSPYTNYHIRLSKEFDNGLSFSFYAINFLNHLPKILVLNTRGELVPKELNRPISFGGSINYKF